MALAYVKLAIYEAHPDAALPRGYEQRFLLRMLRRQSGAADAVSELERVRLRARCDDLTRAVKSDLERTKNAKHRGRDTLVATAEVIAPQVYLDGLPDQFASTAF